MNKVIITGRIVRDTETKYTAGDKPMCIASYTIACQRKYPHQDEADYIKCKAFGKSGEFADKYFKKGVKVNIVGSYHTGSYTNSRGEKVYTTEVLIEEQEFAESKSSAQQYQQSQGHAQQSPQQQYGGYPQQGYTQQNFQGYQQPAAPAAQPQYSSQPQQTELDGFMNIPDDIDESLPFV